MTVLERLKAAGYDPAVSMFPDSIGKAGSMECERVQIRTFFCRPRENEAAIGVTATAMTHFPTARPVRTRTAGRVVLRPASRSTSLATRTFIISATSPLTLSAPMPSFVTGS